MPPETWVKMARNYAVALLGGGGVVWDEKGDSRFLGYLVQRLTKSSNRRVPEWPNYQSERFAHERLASSQRALAKLSRRRLIHSNCRDVFEKGVLELGLF